MSPLSAWLSFYVIVGTSAGALTGLTFLAVTLVAQIRGAGTDQGIATFNTPTVVHFGAVLLISSVLSAPWPALPPPAALLGIAGLAGVIYTAVVARRQRRIEIYTPVFEDWLWYVICPLVGYAALLAAGIALPGWPVAALFAVAAALLLLLFLGIHNAWDIVTYIVVERLPTRNGQDEGAG
jgi:hypothetical protein